MFSELQGVEISLDLAKKVLSLHDDTTSITTDEIQKISGRSLQGSDP